LRASQLGCEWIEIVRGVNRVFRHILIPTDGSELAQNAILYGVALAKEQKAKLTAVTVHRPFHIATLDPEMLEDTHKEYDRHVAEHAAKYLAVVSKAAAAAGVACDVVSLEHQHPYQAIVESARDRQCDLIVMASHGRSGASAVLMGSQTVKVLTHSKVPVLVYR
jgi:nucleotide-binding universal stress UspA family protein